MTSFDAELEAAQERGFVAESDSDHEHATADDDDVQELALGARECVAAIGGAWGFQGVERVVIEQASGEHVALVEQAPRGSSPRSDSPSTSAVSSMKPSPPSATSGSASSPTSSAASMATESRLLSLLLSESTNARFVSPRAPLTSKRTPRNDEWTAAQFQQRAGHHPVTPSEPVDGSAIRRRMGMRDMPLARFQKLPEEKRRAILDAAAEEFAQHGFDAASFNRIIAAAGISKGAMYYYFADKGDAYGAVLDDVMDQVEQLMHGLEAPTDREGFWTTLAAGSARLNASFFDDPQTAALMRGLYARGPGDATYLRLIERSRGWVNHILVTGQALGAVRDDVPRDLLVEMVTAMMATTDRWFERAMHTTPMPELIALSDKVLELIRDLLEKKS